MVVNRKRIVFILILIISTGKLFSQHCECNTINYTYWMLQKEWSNGFKALPDVSTNLKEFYHQSYKNKKRGMPFFHGLQIQTFLIYLQESIPFLIRNLRLILKTARTNLSISVEQNLIIITLTCSMW